MATICLYDKEPYQSEFTATVADCTAWDADKEKGSGGEDAYGVILDRTLFFPEQGGQSADRGVLLSDDGKEIRVKDAKIRDGVIIHRTDAPLKPGEKVRGRIDFARRFSFMQQHTGEHILSGLICTDKGYRNVGFHLSDSTVTLDVDGGLSRAECAELETKANQVICRDLPVTVFYPTAEEEARISYRSKKEVDGPLRLVEIPGVDVCACCAPHVRRTGEIGILKIMDAQSYKGGTRLTILCGFRALEAFRRQDEILSSLAHSLNAAREELPARLEQTLHERRELSYKIGELRRQAAAKGLEESVGGPPYLFFTDDADDKTMRDVIRAFLKERKEVCGIFAGSDETSYHYMIGSTRGECVSIEKRLCSAGARGGGKPDMIQGSIQCDKMRIRELLAEALSEI